MFFTALHTFINKILKYQTPETHNKLRIKAAVKKKRKKYYSHKSFWFGWNGYI